MTASRDLRAQRAITAVADGLPENWARFFAPGFRIRTDEDRREKVRIDRLLSLLVETY